MLARAKRIMQLSEFHAQLCQANPKHEDYAQRTVDTLLRGALRLQASDVHVQPTPEGHLIRVRLDGVLQKVGEIPRGEQTDIAARLKVLAGLLTYRTDIPQEGRVRDKIDHQEIRISSFPSLHGERVVVRILWHQQSLSNLSDLGLPENIATDLERLLQQSSGMILIAGPSGSGKSTTAYACLRHIVQASNSGRSVVTLEDPIETEIAEISQSQIHVASGFDFATGLRSLMRQDPEVIFVGEIRDPATAETAMQASMTGQLVLSTFHSGSAAEAIRRLIDMGVPPYMIQSSLLGVLHLRLVRKLCDCAEGCGNHERLGFYSMGMKKPKGCQACQMTGYQGRTLLAEWLCPGEHHINNVALQAASASYIESYAVQFGMQTRWDQAEQLLTAGTTSPAEIRRVLGFQREEES